MGTIPEVRGVHEARGERILDVMDPSGVRAEVRRSCRSAVDPLALYRDAAALLAPVVGFDRWCGLLLDPATLLNTGGYHEEGLPMEVLPRLLEIEVGEVDANAIPALGRSEVGVSTLDRATGGRPTDSRRFREVLEPAGLGREMRAVLRDRGSAWGGLVFFRETADSDFTDAGVALVADVGADLARAVRRCLLHSEHAHRDQPDGPGMALLRVEGHGRRGGHAQPRGSAMAGGGGRRAAPAVRAAAGGRHAGPAGGQGAGGRREHPAAGPVGAVVDALRGGHG